MAAGAEFRPGLGARRLRFDGERVVAFEEKVGGGRGLVNGGVYALARSVVERALGPSIERDWLRGRLSMETDVLFRLIEAIGAL